MYSTLMLVSMALNLSGHKEPRPAFELHSSEHKVIEQTNAERKRHGLPPLAVDTQLVKSARQHTAWMTRTGSLRHTNQAVGENIAMGQRSSLEAVSSWMSSPGHRANILNGAYRKIGVAAFTANDGTIFWCQQFLR